MGPATSTWPRTETDSQRQALLEAADRLLAGMPRRSTGRLSVVQLAIEAEVKYWVVAQKHTDLRDHFQNLACEAGKLAPESRPVDAHTQLQQEHDKLRKHCQGLEKLLALYATAINELTLENQALRDQAIEHRATVTPLDRTRHSREIHC
ncbi:hypothetical protein [Saccharopolyspora sp. ASAGF58]|uniref:hypothetical protein n=1 Tax=Saccharopolyspora sp. ASAGF58 TaxID=2719023 RepID=UPI00143FDB15|nr:hypothetical protein [Saccharopolyspora sp. ASAGF58]QIZ37117.1 hypothetical protein FDZ84_23880 [Saccharopolyspora sp. ASAGF58]